MHAHLQSRFRVLVVEDNPADADLIREMLSESGPNSFQIESVQLLSDALAVLESKAADLVLLDLGLPDSQGLQTYRLLGQAVPEIPVIVLTGTKDMELAVTALREGAQDFLVKGEFSANLLARATQYAVERKRLENVRSFLAQKASAPGEQPFFSALARYLAKALGMDFICIDRLEGDGLSARTVAVWSDGHFEDNMTYALKDTPCGELVGQHVCCFASRVRQLFPHDQTLQTLQAESYVGVTLCDHVGKPIGLIAAIGRSPMVNRAQAETTMTMVAMRAAGEMERLAIEAEVQKTELRWRFALQASHLGAWELNPLTHSTEHTLIHDQIFGYESPVPDWSYEKFLEHVLPDERLEVDSLFREATASHSDWEFECRIRRVDGEVRWIWVAGTHAQDPEDNVERTIGVVQDITLRKEAEEVLKAAHAEIESFTNAVSHDLQSPLVTIKTFLGYLEEDLKTNKTESVAKDLGFIHGAVDKMERMLCELLQMARIGHHTNPPATTTLQEIMKEVLDILAGQIAVGGVQVAVTEKPIWLTGDRDRLVEAFQNLVDNAVKFLGDQPQPRIEIGAEQEGDEVVLFVRDNGKGIDPRHHDKVFGLFEKLDKHAPGSGLGLALVRRIVELHGGRIRVESEGVGHGATFRFTLANTQLQQPASNAERRMHHVENSMLW